MSYKPLIFSWFCNFLPYRLHFLISINCCSHLAISQSISSFFRQVLQDEFEWQEWKQDETNPTHTHKSLRLMWRGGNLIGSCIQRWSSSTKQCAVWIFSSLCCFKSIKLMMLMPCSGRDLFWRQNIKTTNQLTEWIFSTSVHLHLKLQWILFAVTVLPDCTHIKGGCCQWLYVRIISSGLMMIGYSMLSPTLSFWKHGSCWCWAATKLQKRHYSVWITVWPSELYDRHMAIIMKICFCLNPRWMKWYPQDNSALQRPV